MQAHTDMPSVAGKTIFLLYLFMRSCYTLFIMKSGNPTTRPFNNSFYTHFPTNVQGQFIYYLGDAKTIIYQINII